MRTSITSILASAYASAPLTSTSNKPSTNVDPTTYDGSWKGAYWNGKKFELTISDVYGFRGRGQISEWHGSAVPGGADQGFLVSGSATRNSC
jgi:hypothetical protein